MPEPSTDHAKEFPRRNAAPAGSIHDGVTSWLDRRVLLVAGKGGVGRSTTALALAQSLAAAGHETLLLEATIGTPGPSAFAAHLTSPAGPATQRIARRLSYARLEPRMGQELFLREIVPIPALVHAALHSRALARLLDAGPALDELGVMHHFLTLAEEERDGALAFDRIVLDLPATGHAIALAELPNTILRIAPHGPIADRLRRGQALLHDPVRTGAVIVTIPEPLALREAVELAAGLTHAHVPIAAYLVNRAPTSPTSPGARKELDAVFGSDVVLGRRTLDEQLTAVERIDDLRRDVAPVPVWRAEDAPGDAAASLAAIVRGLAPTETP